MNITDTFQSDLKRPYSRANWQEWLKAIFIRQIDFEAKPQPITSTDPKVKSIERFAAIRLADGKNLAVLDIEIAAHVQIARNRVGLRDIAASLIDHDRYHGLLALYHGGRASSRPEYRLSLISSEPVITPDGKFALHQTAPKRYTYVLGETQSTRTASDRLKAIASNPGKATLGDLKDAFSVEPLTREFYKELFDWYLWALKDETGVTYPDGKKEEHLIRLITRLMFVWFIKQKDLVPETIFDIEGLHGILKGFAPSSPASGSYYNAILQNLFFATLNRPITEREFATDRTYQGKDKHHGAKIRFRDDKESSWFKDKGSVIGIFKTVPFLNGGLFECLDKETETDGKVTVHYFDGFSRDATPNKRAFLPNVLFFGAGRDGSPSRPQPEGLIPLLKRYNFTIEENTPDDADVALDPELLGKVFENLLGAYNPETQETARKQSGSFYTPREIVNYMVDESLKAYLCNNGIPAAEIDTLFTPLPTSSLLPTPSSLSPRIREALLACKILDPACGSGAFPMGILNRIIGIIERLGLPAHIPPYDLKRHLIENCIFGVDVQTIAVQISKLRFFISLVVEQTPNDDPADNYGIRPLPNLETKFVAANTLIGLKPREKQGDLFEDPRIEPTKRSLLEVRHLHFSADTAAKKKRHRADDQRLRQTLADLLQADGAYAPADARQLADWNPYDQNASSPFFDPEWMFGIKDGFDIVIGNPPYVRADEQSDWNQCQRKLIKASGQYETLREKWDLFVPFLERGYKLLRPNGVSALIVSDAFCHSKYAQKPQDWFLKNARVLRLDFCGDIKIFDAAVHNVIPFIQKTDGAQNIPERRFHKDTFGNIVVLSSDKQQNLTHRVFFPNENESTLVTWNVKIVELSSIVYISTGMSIHASEKIAHGAFTKDDVISKVKDPQHPKPFVEGKYLMRWLPKESIWLEWGTKRAPSQFREPRFPELFEVSEKLISVDMVANAGNLRVAYDNQQFFHNQSAWSFVLWHSLSGVRNNSLKKVARYMGEKPPRPDLPKRETLEGISRRFEIKYLLGVMNSTVARDYLRANRRSNIHLYPDDWKKLPIPDVPLKQQKPIITLVDKILSAKIKNPSTDTSDLERQIDTLVYALYGLTEEEVKVVEGKKEI